MDDRKPAALVTTLPSTKRRPPSRRDVSRASAVLCFLVRIALVLPSSACGLVSIHDAARANRPVPLDYDLAELTKPVAPGKVHPEPAVVDLRDLQATARKWLEQPSPKGPLSLGGLTSISGYRWSRSRQTVEIMGERGGAAPEILVDEFVEALRSSPEGSLWMSLDPPLDEGLEGMTGWHAVHGHPESILQTRYFNGLVQADYVMKALSLEVVPSPHLDSLVERARERVTRCDSDDAPRGAAPTIENQYFAIDWDHNDPRRTASADGHEIYLGKMPIVILTGPTVQTSATMAFAKQFSDNFDQLEQEFPIALGRHHNLFRLYFLTQLLQVEKKKGNIEFDDQFWMSEYRPLPFRAAKRLPGFGPFRFGRFCEGPKFQYKNRLISYVLAGGVVMRMPPDVTGRLLSIDSLPEQTARVYFARTDLDEALRVLVLSATGSFFLRENQHEVRGRYSSTADRITLDFPDGTHATGAITPKGVEDPTGVTMTPLQSGVGFPVVSLRLFCSLLDQMFPGDELHSAASAGRAGWLPPDPANLATVSKLLAAGADPNAPDAAGRSALQVAA
ncbi:MAG TPA: hypothetical protein PL196_02960, partial [Burkholderiaceae bacterium]|nr:hypothetical protein [Burkholderiaceae bacterium]